MRYISSPWKRRGIEKIVSHVSKGKKQEDFDDKNDLLSVL